MPGPEREDVADTLDQWRHDTFDRIVAWTAIVCVFAYVLVAIAGGFRREAVVYTLPLWIVPGLYTLRRKLTFQARAAVFTAATFGVGVISFMLIGFSPNISLLFVLAAVVAAIWIGPRSAVGLALGSIVVVWIAVGIRIVTGWEPPLHDVLHGNNTNLFRMATSYTILGMLVVASVAYAIAMVERQARERAVTLERLRGEIEQRTETEAARRKAEHAMVQSQKLELVGRMASGVSHDFNNALTVILTWAEILRRNPKDLADGLDAIRQAGLSSAQLTRRLLVFGRSAPREPRPVALDQHIVELGRTLEKVLPENIKLEVGSDGVPLVLADAGELDQAVLNLALNARDAMPDGGTLKIRAIHGAPRAAGDGEPRTAGDGAPRSAGDGAPRGEASRHAGRAPRWVGLQITDTGTGIDEATQARLFEPFFTTKGARGTGLGLASVRAIVDALGGHVELDSVLGRGTTFTLWIPARPDAVVVDATPMGTPVVRRATILLVEDDPALRRVMGAALRAAGHDVLDASNVEGALEIARRMRGEISLLCTDGVMPGASVRHLIDSFRQLYPGAPVLLCSGYLSPDLPVPEDLGAAFLPKPFEASTLQAKVGELLASRGVITGAGPADARA